MRDRLERRARIGRQGPREGADADITQGARIGSEGDEARSLRRVPHEARRKALDEITGPGDEGAAAEFLSTFGERTAEA